MTKYPPWVSPESQAFRQMGMSPRMANALARARVTPADLAQMNLKDLMRYKSIGVTTAREILRCIEPIHNEYWHYVEGAD